VVVLVVLTAAAAARSMYNERIASDCRGLLVVLLLLRVVLVPLLVVRLDVSSLIAVEA
jgi:hypothetical protein